MIRLLLILLVSFSAIAGPKENLNQGDQTAQTLLNQMDQKKAAAGAHPFYQGISKEANYQVTDLVGKSQAVAIQDPASQMIHQSSDARPQVKMDPAKDPLLTGSQKITGNPLEVIGGAGTQVTTTQQGGKTETVICEEGGEDSLETCTRELVVKVIKTKVEKEWRGQFRYWKERKAEKHGHYLACASLRGGMPEATRRQSGDVTAAYKACMRELGNRLSAGCVTLPRLPFSAAQIVSISFVMRKHEGRSRRYRPSKLYVTANGYVDINDHGTKYDLSPHIIITHEEDAHEVLPDEWSDNCARLEEQVDQGLCGYHSRACTQGP